MRSLMADARAFMQGHARPGDALHVGHRRVIVDVGMMIAVALDHAEHAERSEMAGHAGRNRRIGDVHAVAVKMQSLLIDRNEDFQRAFRNVAERKLARVLRLLAGRLVLEHGFCRRRRRTHRHRQAESEQADIAEQDAFDVPNGCGAAPRSVRIFKCCTSGEANERLEQQILVDKPTSRHQPTGA